MEQAMIMHLDEQLVRERLDEARAYAARQALIRSLRPVRRPVRVIVGVALIKIGRWVAGQAPKAIPKRSREPGRVTA
jgi:hypothetical protein